LTSSQLELSPQSDALIVRATGNQKWVELLAGTAQLHRLLLLSAVDLPSLFLPALLLSWRGKNDTEHSRTN
jgi:hypothetical protein